MNVFKLLKKNSLASYFSPAERIYLLFWFVLMSLIWKNMFVYDGNSYWAGWGHLWADWSAHITYTLNMTYRSLLLPYHPLWWGSPFRYHFAADMISALLLRSGVPLMQAFILPSILCSYALITSVYLFYRTIFKNRLIAMVSTPLFIFNGGLGFIWYIFYKFTGNPILNMTSPLFTFSQITDVKIEFANILTNYFIPQRPFLLGFPISIFIIIYFWVQLNLPNKSRNVLHSILLGLLTGIFPVIHLYAYVMILIFTGFFALWDTIRRKTVYPFWITYFLLSLSIGAGIILSLWGQSQVINHIIYSPFWPADGKILQWLYYWTMNSGILFIFFPVGFYYATKTEKS